MSTRQRYYLSIDDLAAARGEDAELAFDGKSPQALGQAVQSALQSDALFERWRAKQPEPDEVDPALAPVDPQAQAQASQADLKVDLTVTTTLPMRVLKHRLGLLLGPHWRLHDVRTA
ncbi:hypothetical protein [Oleiagrimonas sp. C23AA]|uniref:hypothetical protein n=1 Tax=Oleiagrimonas sp. C23AA TaxID=2719047 RepID=UPI001421EAD0|nr:hypothetical protein [Oleiagrimonas sp. C23AA]NII11405.1 hypothetical protein [Oleiagrimonas sp. C23AA]